METGILDKWRTEAGTRANGLHLAAHECLMFEARTKRNGWVRLPYSALLGTEYTPDSRVRLVFVTHIVDVEGKNLEALYEAIGERKVSRVDESGSEYGDSAGPAVETVGLTARR